MFDIIGFNFLNRIVCSAVAQLVERLAVNEDVTGPSPVRGADDLKVAGELTICIAN